MNATLDRIIRHIAPNPFRKRYLRSWELRLRGVRHVGRNVKIERSVKIVNPGWLEIGDNVIIDQFTTIVCGSPKVRIGSYVHIAGNCHIAGGGGVDIGDFANISHGCKLFSVSDDYSGGTMTNPTVPKAYTAPVYDRVSVGKHVIIGASSVVLPGVDLAEGCAIGAMTLVTKSTDPWGIYGGAPARRLRDRSDALLGYEAELLKSASQGHR